MVQEPTKVVNMLAKQLGSKVEIKIPNDKFFIEPNVAHIVAGNPMRYLGRKQVIYDDRWKKELSSEELNRIGNWKK